MSASNTVAVLLAGWMGWCVSSTAGTEGPGAQAGGQARKSELQGPVGLVSETNASVFTSCSWEYQEGNVFPYREPLTGIRIRIPPETDAATKQ